MAFGHKQRDVDRAAIESVGLAYRYCETLKGQRDYAVREELGEYRVSQFDADAD